MPTATMAPRRKTEHPVQVHPEYLAELRRRIEAGPGMRAVARAAKMSRTTLWSLLTGTAGRSTADAAERARRALAKLEPAGAPMPPPIVSVRGPAHHAWIVLGEQLLAEDPAAVLAATSSPASVRAAVLGRRRRR